LIEGLRKIEEVLKIQYDKEEAVYFSICLDDRKYIRSKTIDESTPVHEYTILNSELENSN
jgi:hypothetical protein